MHSQHQWKYIHVYLAVLHRSVSEYVPACHACVYQASLCESLSFVLNTAHKHVCWQSSSCHLQLCPAECPARQWTEVCSLLITPSAHGWPTSATAATGSPPKSWRPQSASQTAPGATTIRYPDASVSRRCLGRRRDVKEEGRCLERRGSRTNPQYNWAVGWRSLRKSYVEDTNLGILTAALDAERSQSLAIPLEMLWNIKQF